MSLDHLWAGWRAGYVASVSDGVEYPPVDTLATASHSGYPIDEEEPSDCVFCAIATSAVPDEELYVLYRGESTFAVLNAYPYASGHLLVMPNRHVGDISELTGDEYTELFDATRLAMLALEDAYHADGMNMGANFGRAAGAGIPRHLHVHVLPRWLGDTNFMTTVASTRVMPEALSDSWLKVRAAWPS
ncbi:MAG TPA: HIT domain-containing protein [Acidimicrobiales bacterium]|nr:HIT domain-containing protein [Acidimicrobiales bacterium]